MPIAVSRGIRNEGAWRSGSSASEYIFVIDKAIDRFVLRPPARFHLTRRRVHRDEDEEEEEEVVVDEDEVSPPRELPAHGPSNLPSLAQRVYTLHSELLYARSCFEHRARPILLFLLSRPFPSVLVAFPTTCHSATVLSVLLARYTLAFFLPRNVTFTPGFVIRRMPMPLLFIANDGCLLHSLCGISNALFFLYITRLRVSKVSLRGCNVTVDL